VIYAYGIGDPTAGTPPRQRGLGGARLRELETGGLAAVYSRHRTLHPRPSPGLVCAHERVVEAIMARGTVLPLRFGTVLEREDQLAAVVEKRKDELHSALERVRGHVELGLRLLRSADPDPEMRSGDTSGRAYLLARAAEHRRADKAIADVHAPLAELAAASVVRNRPRPPAIMIAAYLVDAVRVADFRLRADEIAARHEDLQLIVTGPWPPYNFATGSAHEDRG
jgi:hypothetical protein